MKWRRWYEAVIVLALLLGLAACVGLFAWLGYHLAMAMERAE